MGLLSDVFSYGDSLKRKIGGLLADPMGTIDLGARRFAEDQQGLLGMSADAGYMPGQRSVLTSPQQQAIARKMLADQAAQQAMSAATVWHGSPHKFDKFDASKIGTGEGAQAYGHGLYLADAKQVADEYAGKLSKSIVDFKNKAPSDEFEIALQKSYQELADRTQLGSKGTTIFDVWNKHANPVNDFLYGNSYAGVKPMDPEKLKRALAYRDAAKRLGEPVLSDTGSLYKVDLPDEHIAKMLDWDKPLSVQAPGVQALFDDIKRLQDPYIRSKTSTGEAMGELAGLLGGRAQASEHLRSKGIPGIRYLDGGSRGAGAGSSNYVIFPGNEGLLQILERNGQPVR